MGIRVFFLALGLAAVTAFGDVAEEARRHLAAVEALQSAIRDTAPRRVLRENNPYVVAFRAREGIAPSVPDLHVLGIIYGEIRRVRAELAAVGCPERSAAQGCCGGACWNCPIRLLQLGGLVARVPAGDALFRALDEARRWLDDPRSKPSDRL